jgi:hypothetical protein
MLHWLIAEITDNELQTVAGFQVEALGNSDAFVFPRRWNQAYDQSPLPARTF